MLHLYGDRKIEIDIQEEPDLGRKKVIHMKDTMIFSKIAKHFAILRSKANHIAEVLSAFCLKRNKNGFAEAMKGGEL